MRRSRGFTAIAGLAWIAVFTAGCGLRLKPTDKPFFITKVTHIGNATCHQLKNEPDELEKGLVVWGGAGSTSKRPVQPPGGQWFEESSPYTGLLLTNTQYYCAMASVTVERDPAVAPNYTFKVGSPVTLFVTHRHGGGPEAKWQYLAYSVPIETPGQTEVVFHNVVLRSATPATDSGNFFSQPYKVYFGMWPHEAGDNNPRYPYGYTKPKECEWSSTQGIVC